MTSPHQNYNIYAIDHSEILTTLYTVWVNNWQFIISKTNLHVNLHTLSGFKNISSIQIFRKEGVGAYKTTLKYLEKIIVFTCTISNSKNRYHLSICPPKFLLSQHPLRINDVSCLTLTGRMYEHACHANVCQYNASMYWKNSSRDFSILETELSSSVALIVKCNMNLRYKKSYYFELFSFVWVGGYYLQIVKNGVSLWIFPSQVLWD